MDISAVLRADQFLDFGATGCGDSNLPTSFPGSGITNVQRIIGENETTRIVNK